MTGTTRLRVLCGALIVAAMALASTAQATVCVIGPNADLPPNCFGGNGYLSPNDVHMIINGLPPGTTIELGAEHRDFFNVTRLVPGGTLGGEQENFQSALTLHLTGTGAAAGYNRFLTMQTTDQTSIAPRNPVAPVQSFDTEMNGIQGQLPPGDPDFDLLRITAGGLFGLPSPGHTTLTQIAPNQWNVDSFFDITYRIDFVGHPGGPFGGMSGSTTGTIRMQAGEAAVPEPTTFGLFGLAALGSIGFARRSRRP
jgi:hypothetical protein